MLFWVAAEALVFRTASRAAVSTPRARSSQDWEYGLEELALYFLLYSEAANLRHTPELLWFIFWVARNSPHRWEAVSCPPGEHPSSPLFAYQHLGRADVMQRTASLRRRHARTLREAEKALGPVPDLVMPKVRRGGGVHGSVCVCVWVIETSVCVCGIRNGYR